MADKIPGILAALQTRVAPYVSHAIGHIPAGVILGSGALSLMTFNKAIVVFTAFLVEVVLLQTAMSAGARQLFPTLVSGTAGFPFLPLYFITSALTYLNGSLVLFSDVFDRLGGEYPTKFGTAVTLSILTIVALLSYFVVGGQQTFAGALLTVLFGLFTGSLLLIFHELLFGQDAINMLGVPLLVSRVGTGKPLYVCGVPATAM
jgi:hypothetical protein